MQNTMKLLGKEISTNIEYNNLVETNQVVADVYDVVPQKYLFCDYNCYKEDEKEVIDTMIEWVQEYISDKGGTIRFSAVAPYVPTTEVKNLEELFSYNNFTKAIYKWVHEFSFVKMELLRAYCTRMDKDITPDNFKQSDVLPHTKDRLDEITADKDSKINNIKQYPDVVVSKMQNLLSCERAEIVRDVDKSFGVNYPSVDDYNYAYHIDFKLHFDFKSKKAKTSLKRALYYNSNYSGLTLSFLYWFVNDDDWFNKGFYDSDVYFLNNYIYDCPLRTRVQDDVICFGDGLITNFYVPKTKEWWLKRYYSRMRLKKDEVTGEVLYGQPELFYKVPDDVLEMLKENDSKLYYIATGIKLECENGDVDSNIDNNVSVKNDNENDVVEQQEITTEIAAKNSVIIYNSNKSNLSTNFNNISSGNIERKIEDKSDDDNDTS